MQWYGKGLISPFLSNNNYVQSVSTFQYTRFTVIVQGGRLLDGSVVRTTRTRCSCVSDYLKPGSQV